VRWQEPLAAFYRECIGLTPAETGDGYRELRADGLVLWLVRGRQSPGADTDRDGSVRRPCEAPVKLAFEVGSIERVAASIESSGRAMAQTSWNFAGYRRRDAVDPEGTIIQLLEPLVPLS
jgi:predicted enzyme related to lactoylglutathione lyase